MNESASREVVSVTSVSKAFGGTQALRDVSMSLNSGEARALIGQNGAGKSTLMSLLTGLTRPDSGSIEIHADLTTGNASGLGCVHQHSTLIPAATAAENISLGGEFPTSRIGLIDWREVSGYARDSLREWGAESIADTVAENLDPIEQKIVQICTAMALNPSVLLLDEPTAGLDKAAARRLFQHLSRLRNRGVTLLYVSHHLEEIFEVCDTVTVLRDGMTVLTGNLESLSMDDIVDSMVGSAAILPVRARPQAIDASEGRGELATTARIEELACTPRLKSLTMSLHRGEIVGLTGLDGCGAVEVAEVLAGLRSPSSGRIQINGAPLPFGNVQGCLAAGVGFTPEDRHVGGFIPALSVAENATITILDRFINRLRLIRPGERNAHYARLSDRWSIRASSSRQPVEELSGGNQQKVVLARSLASDPRLLVLVNPTAGVDVSAKASIYATLRELAGNGLAILIVSSELSDLDLCDRVLAMFRGTVTSELLAPVSERDITSASQGGSTNP